MAKKKKTETKVEESNFSKLLKEMAAAANALPEGMRPEAMYIQIHTENGQLLQKSITNPGFNLLRALGGFSLVAHELSIGLKPRDPRSPA